MNKRTRKSEEGFNWLRDYGIEANEWSTLHTQFKTPRRQAREQAALLLVMTGAMVGAGARQLLRSRQARPT